MARLMDMGLERLKNLLIEMGQLSEKTVQIAIDAYTKRNECAYSGLRQLGGAPSKAGGG